MKCCSMLLANVTFMGYFKVLFFPNRQHFDGFFLMLENEMSTQSTHKSENP